VAAQNFPSVISDDHSEKASLSSCLQKAGTATVFLIFVTPGRLAGARSQSFIIKAPQRKSHCEAYDHMIIDNRRRCSLIIATP